MRNKERRRQVVLVYFVGHLPAGRVSGWPQRSQVDLMSKCHRWTTVRLASPDHSHLNAVSESRPQNAVPRLRCLNYRPRTWSNQRELRRAREMKLVSPGRLGVAPETPQAMW